MIHAKYACIHFFVAQKGRSKGDSWAAGRHPESSYTQVHGPGDVQQLENLSVGNGGIYRYTIMIPEWIWNHISPILNSQKKIIKNYPTGKKNHIPSEKVLLKMIVLFPVGGICDRSLDRILRTCVFCFFGDGGLPHQSPQKPQISPPPPVRWNKWYYLMLTIFPSDTLGSFPPEPCKY